MPRNACGLVKDIPSLQTGLQQDCLPPKDLIWKRREAVFPSGLVFLCFPFTSLWSHVALVPYSIAIATVHSLSHARHRHQPNTLKYPHRQCPASSPVQPNSVIFPPLPSSLTFLSGPILSHLPSTVLLLPQTSVDLWRGPTNTGFEMKARELG